MNKKEMYYERVLLKDHPVKMHISSDFFDNGAERKRTEKLDALKKLRHVVRNFNLTVHKYTKADDYQVLLSLGIIELAGDFCYQYKRFLQWAKDIGLYIEVRDDLLVLDSHYLYSQLSYPKAQGYVSFDIEQLLEVLPNIHGTPLGMLIYMKCRSSRPTSKEGITGLTDVTIAHDLGINRTTVFRARKVLTELNLIEQLSQETLNIDGKFVTYTKTRLNF